MLSMIAGFITALHGIYYQIQSHIYIGLIIISITSVSWWIWVMMVIKRMYHATGYVMSNVGDVREAIKEIKKLVEEYKFLTKDK